MLIDFGIASDLGSLGSHTGGTPMYVPPEFLIRRTRGKKADIWGLGVTMLYVVGAAPYPEAVVRKQNQHWLLADAVGPPTQGRTEARHRMAGWLRRVAAWRTALDPIAPGLQGRINAIIRSMLVEDVERRVAPQDILDSLTRAT